MPDLDDVAAYVLSLEGVTEVDRRGTRTWVAARRTFAWERPFTGADRKRFGSAPIPSLPVLAVRVGDLHEKAAVLAERHAGVFDIPHLDGFAAVLVELAAASPEMLDQLLLDGWRWARG